MKITRQKRIGETNVPLKIEHAVWATKTLPEIDNHTNIVHLTLWVYKCTELTW